MTSTLEKESSLPNRYVAARNVFVYLNHVKNRFFYKKKNLQHGSNYGLYSCLPWVAIAMAYDYYTCTIGGKRNRLRCIEMYRNGLHFRDRWVACNLLEL